VTSSTLHERYASSCIKSGSEQRAPGTPNWLLSSRARSLYGLRRGFAWGATRYVGAGWNAAGREHDADVLPAQPRYEQELAQIARMRAEREVEA
jgi:hypothetical protein